MTDIVVVVEGIEYKVVYFFSHKKFKRATYWIQDINNPLNTFCISDDELEEYL